MIFVLFLYSKHICASKSTHGPQGCNSFMDILSCDPYKISVAEILLVHVFPTILEAVGTC